METAEKAAESVQKGSKEEEQVASVEAVEAGAKTEAKAEAETEVRAAEKEVKIKKERGKQEHPMRRIELDKVVINIGVGESGEKLKNAERIIEQITGQKPVETLAKRTIQPFGIKKGEPIGCKVTLRKEKAYEFLRKVFKIQNRLYESQFDAFGNLSFGIEEHTDLGIPYDPAVGIFGMDVSVSLKRPGFRIKERRIQRRKLPKKQRITREEGINFFIREFGVNVIEE